MKFGNYDINEKAVPKEWKAFQSFYDDYLKGKIVDPPEVVFEALGGKLPSKKEDKKGGE